MPKTRNKTPIQRRSPVARALPRLSGGGPHRAGATRADLKRELRKQLARGQDGVD